MKPTVILLAMLLAACALRPSVKAPLRLQAGGIVSQSAVDDAADWWNARIGCRVFDGPRGGFDILVADGLDRAGLVGLWDAPGLISVFNVTDDVSLHFVLVHEMGHALGVGHSDHPASIMNRQPLSTVDLLGDEEQFAAFPWVESAVLAGLRAEYCAGRR